MDMLREYLPILAAIAALVTIVRGLAALILMPPENYQTIIRRMKKWLSTAAMITLVVLGLTVGLASGWQVIKFGLSTDPLTRKDVWMLMLNMWNTLAYLGCTISIPLISKAIRLRDETYRVDAQT